MTEGNSDRQGCMRYCTCRRMGFTPALMRRSNKDWTRPAAAAFLHMTTGPNWQWSPTNTICLDPRTMGMRHSGSVACVHSSINTFWNVQAERRGSPAPTHVQHTTSAAMSISRSAMRFKLRNFLSSAADSSPCSSRSCGGGLLHTEL